MKLLLFSFILGCSLGQAQNLDSYEYAVIKSKFDFQANEGEYRLNMLSKAFLMKYGFETYIDSEILPDDLANNNCKAIYVDVVDNGGMITTRVNIVIKNCKNEIIYTSPEGSSRDKKYKLAYDEALREAFANALPLKSHKYSPSSNVIAAAHFPAAPIDISKATESDYKVVKMVDGYSIESPLLKSPIRLFRTSNSNNYIATWQDRNGTATVKDGFMLLEYYEGGQLRKLRLTVALGQ